MEIFEGPLFKYINHRPFPWSSEMKEIEIDSLGTFDLDVAGGDENEEI
jgi:hypothetical protein